MAGGARSQQVAEFVQGVLWSDIPAGVHRQVLRCVLDLCGTALGGSRTKVAEIAARYARAAHGPGPATLIGTDGDSTAAGAALANGFAASALDVDDGYRPVKGHPGAVVFPAVLAAAEHAGASGAEFLTALVCAYEVSMRAGLILHPLYGFYHGTGSWGPLGAAAGAGRLLGLTVDQTWHALGIAEFHAAMTPEMRSVDHPSMLKDGIGWGATVGLASAQLAAHGFTGIPSLFDAHELGLVLAGSLGDDYLMHGLYFKPYTCCRWAQPAVEATLAAAASAGLAAAEVAAIRVHTFEAAMHLRPTAPRTTEEAQFSLPWPVACALLDGAVGAEQVLGPALADPARQALAARVEVVHDPALEEPFPARALAWAEVIAHDGRRARSAVMAARGDADVPLTDGEIARKFMHLAEPVVGRGAAEALAAGVEALPEAPDVRQLTALLRPAGPAPSAVMP
jgi:2-methylcitrate dehydratase PrpD